MWAEQDVPSVSHMGVCGWGKGRFFLFPPIPVMWNGNNIHNCLSKYIAPLCKEERELFNTLSGFCCARKFPLSRSRPVLTPNQRLLDGLFDQPFIFKSINF